MKLLIVLLVVLLANTSSAQETRVQSKFKFSLRDVQGEDVAFDTLLGKGPVLLAFWASWCEPCENELKAFQILGRKHRDRGLRVVAINIDKVKSLSKVKSYVTTQGFDFPILLDPSGDIARDIFSVESLPNSFLLRPDGTVKQRFGEYAAGFENEVERAFLDLIESN